MTGFFGISIGLLVFRGAGTPATNLAPAVDEGRFINPEKLFGARETVRGSFPTRFVLICFSGEGVVYSGPQGIYHPPLQWPAAPRSTRRGITFRWCGRTPLSSVAPSRRAPAAGRPFIKVFFWGSTSAFIFELLNVSIVLDSCTLLLIPKNRALFHQKICPNLIFLILKHLLFLTSSNFYHRRADFFAHMRRFFPACFCSGKDRPRRLQGVARPWHGGGPHLLTTRPPEGHGPLASGVFLISKCPPHALHNNSLRSPFLTEEQNFELRFLSLTICPSIEWPFLYRKKENKGWVKNKEGPLSPKVAES